jgi:signal transduction histidine kinase
MKIDTAALRAEAHVEIGSLLQSGSDAIVERWCKAVRTESPAVRGLHEDVLRDELPALLSAIGRNLAQAGTSQAALQRDVAKEHGAQRWDAGWSLVEVVRDYQLMRVAILAFLDENLQRPLQYREAAAVGVLIDDAVATSVARYVAYRDRHAQLAEKERATALETLSRRKDEFLAILGHELRNPLAPIRNSVAVLCQILGDSQPAVRKCLEVLDRQSHQLSRLVDDLLDLSRISRGEFELRTTRMDVRVAVEQALQMNEPLVKARNHHLSVAVPAAPLHVNADPGRVTQIVANLLNNAAKYTDPNGVIALTVTREADDAVITISDNGIGLEPEARERVFELFARVDERDSEREGLGIGLALVQRLVQQHGGTIEVKSDGLGKGAEFTVRLPAADEAEAESVLVIKQVREDRH